MTWALSICLKVTRPAIRNSKTDRFISRPGTIFNLPSVFRNSRSVQDGLLRFLNSAVGNRTGASFTVGGVLHFWAQESARHIARYRGTRQEVSSLLPCFFYAGHVLLSFFTCSRPSVRIFSLYTDHVCPPRRCRVGRVLSAKARSVFSAAGKPSPIGFSASGYSPPHKCVAFWMSAASGGSADWQGEAAKSAGAAVRHEAYSLKITTFVPAHKKRAHHKKNTAYTNDTTVLWTFFRYSKKT